MLLINLLLFVPLFKVIKIKDTFFYYFTSFIFVAKFVPPPQLLTGRNLLTGFDVFALCHHFSIDQSLRDRHHFGLDCLGINGILQSVRRIKKKEFETFINLKKHLSFLSSQLLTCPHMTLLFFSRSKLLYLCMKLI